jgi:hypothetical protein
VKLRTIPLVLLFVSLVVGCFNSKSSVRAGSITYAVSVDTSSIAGATGYVDFQFNPGSSSSLAAGALVDSFATDGTLGAALPNLGDASGALPGPLSFDNGLPTNEVTVAFQFKAAISFDVTLSGLAVGSAGPDASTFFLTLYDVNQNPYSTGPGGAIGTIDINRDGSTTPMTYAPVVVPGPTATISAAAAPEPSSLILCLIGSLGGLTLYWRKQRARREIFRAIQRAATLNCDGRQSCSSPVGPRSADHRFRACGLNDKEPPDGG